MAAYLKRLGKRTNHFPSVYTAVSSEIWKPSLSKTVLTLTPEMKTLATSGEADYVTAHCMLGQLMNEKKKGNNDDLFN